jgi:hypothetical protein
MEWITSGNHRIEVVGCESSICKHREYMCATAPLLSVKCARLFDPSFEVFWGVLHGEDHSNELLV